MDLDLRKKREYTDVILSAMGGVSRVHFSRIKSLLKLSDEALELADRHKLDERTLRYVLIIEPQSQSELIRQIVDFGLTSRQVKQLIDESSEPQEVVDQPTVSRAAIKFAKSTKDTKKTTGGELAHALLLQEQDVGIALARLKAMRELIDEAEQKLLEN